MFLRKSKECINEFLGNKGTEDLFFTEDNVSIKSISEEEVKREFRNLSFLYFSKKIEKIFKAYFLRVKINQIRFALAFGMFLYVIFAVLDYLLFPQVMHDLWIIRAFVVSIGMAVLVYTFVSKGKALVEFFISVVIFVGGMGILLMIILIDFYEEKAHIYYAGLLLVIFFAYTFSSIRLLYALLPSVLVTVAYLVADLTYIKTDKFILINNGFFLVSTNAMGIFAGYMLEYFFRKNFLQSFLIFLDKKKTEYLNKKLYEMTITDELTKVANRRFFQETLEKELKRAYRENYPVSLLMVDVDHFKEYNDSFGHTAGDRCLCSVAKILKKYRKRSYDLVARYGGDEFIVVLPKASEDYAVDVAENIRYEVEKLDMKHVKPFDKVTVSIGVAVLNNKNTKNLSVKDLLNTADKALYRAKKEGRNRVVRLNV
ncbi:diguanylate cyclase [Persephonella sp.]